MLKVTVENNNCAVRVGHALRSTLAEYSSLPVLLLLSTGSNFDTLHHVQLPARKSSLTVGVVDERFSDDPAINNFAQLKNTPFYSALKETGANFIDSRVSKGETLDGYGKRFENLIRMWAKNNPAGKIIATLGIGEDGHIAGMMPHPDDPEKFKNLFEKYVTWVVAYDAGKKNKYPLRATVNNWFLRQKVDIAIIYAVSKKKNPALTKVFTKEGSLAETPARIIHDMRDVQLFTDQKVV